MARFSTILCTRLIPLCLALAASGAPAPASAWVDPSTGLAHPTNVTRRAEIPEKNWQPGHRGVDLGLRPGDPVRAAGAGEVAYVGVVVGVPVVSVVHPSGLRTTYQPVDSRARVGDQVAEGQVIGALSRARPPHHGPHEGLHWGALTGPDTYIDPLSLLAPPRIRLKPVDGLARTPA
ncbi:M23 family metallopeptidase [Corynebacterium aquatimens]|uniref:M23 family metallopeptidase n=1 Tax=Corynebacterium TaxID=1716 RepID=UPI001F2A235D|nr:MULTISPECIES: peptidoglycan DD-metalloendopeptidase family protein [Corynebacterium]QYH19546.1 M23 family metallopeptidase [Corynebacterium aquatimens]UIZ91496.1 M23 family metallopeptidase [Corynebacterium sp. CNCTC7651]